MIFNLSYNWLKEYLPTAPSAKELARLLSLHSVSVERWHDLGEGLDKVVVGEIAGIEPHPNADKLKLVDTKISLLKSLKIVCGGSNLAEGQKVAVALPGAKVRWHGRGEWVELRRAKIRGVESEGMICAGDEIGLGDYFPKKTENEILDLSSLPAKAGTPLSKALDLDDTVMEVEATTNRPDLLSVVGIAREAAAILGQKLNLAKSDFTRFSKSSEGRLQKIKVEVEDKKLCPRYQAVLVQGLKVAPSPPWLKERLAAVGVRAINNVVDVTNYVMLELGQPLHAFDPTLFDKSMGQVKIIVRRAKQGEKLPALDGKEYTLTPEMLVIADVAKPLAIAGVMGGEASGVTTATVSIILESANFDPVSVRRTARALNLYSQSQLRFEKGLSPEGTEPALRRVLYLLQKISSSPLQISKITDIWPKKSKPKVFNLTTSHVVKLIGVKMAPARVKKILTSLGFGVAGGATLKVSPPYWRALDIEDSRDLVEEIARMHGYHNLPAVLPDGQIPVTSPDQELYWEARLKTDLAGYGLTEIYGYSFLSSELLQKTGWVVKDLARQNFVSQNLGGLIKLANPLSEEFEYMRPSLIPSALQVVAENQENFPSGGIFEISKVYHSTKDNELPAEETRLLVSVWSDDQDGQQFFKAKGILESLFAKYQVDYKFVLAEEDKLFHPGRSVDIIVKGESGGPLAEIHPAILAGLKIDRRLAVWELPLKKFIAAARRYGVLKPPPLYPAVKRDLALLADQPTVYADLVSEIKKTDPLISQVELFDVYAGEGVPAGKKSLALHLLYQASERTLSDEEVATIHERVSQTLKKKFGAVIR